MTIRPLFPGQVLFLDLQKCVRPGFLNRPKCPGFGCFLNPAPAEFLTIAACSRDFRVHSFKHSNIVYNFGASGSRYLYVMYLNIFEWAFTLLTFTFDFTITQTLCVKEAHLTRSDICQWAPDLLSSKYSRIVCQSSLLILDLWSVKSDSCSSCWMQGCQVCLFSTEFGYF